MPVDPKMGDGFLIVGLRTSIICVEVKIERARPEDNGNFSGSASAACWDCGVR
jgi:hypothetical protein